MSKTKKMSPADICLKRADIAVPLIGEVNDYVEGLRTVNVEVEIRAWVCPWCNTSTEYVVVNGYCIIGCGKSCLFSNGKKSDCCFSSNCKDEQKKWHDESVEEQDDDQG